MAGLFFVLDSGDVTVDTGDTVTVLSLTAPTNQRVKIHEFTVTCDGAGPTDAMLTLAVQRGSGGTPAGAVTPAKEDPDAAETLQTAAAKDYDGAEPTFASVLHAERFHPQQGTSKTYPALKELVVDGAALMGFTLTNPGGGSNRVCRVVARCEE